MTDKLGRDQFVLRAGDMSEVNWNDGKRGRCEEVRVRSDCELQTLKFTVMGGSRQCSSACRRSWLQRWPWLDEEACSGRGRRCPVLARMQACPHMGTQVYGRMAEPRSHAPPAPPPPPLAPPPPFRCTSGSTGRRPLCSGRRWARS